MAKRRRKHQDHSVPPSPYQERNAAPAALEVLRIDLSLVIATTDCGDQGVALGLGRDHVDGRFMATFGDLVTQLERQAAFLGGRVDVAMSALTRNDRHLAAEPLQIQAAYQNGGVDGPADPAVETPPSKWQLRDKVNAIVGCFLIISLMIASYLGFYASFINAQLEVFHDLPYVPLSLAVLAPAAGYALKAAGNTFTDPLTKDRYRQAVIIAGLAAFFIYVPIFGLQFKGLSGAWDPYATKSAFLAWAFNVAHVFAETLIAAGIFAQLDATASKYAPSQKVDNPHRPPLKREDQAQTALTSARVSAAADPEGELARIYGFRTDAHTFVKTAILQRMNQEPPKSLL